MKTTHLTAALLLSTALATPALAQDSQPYALDEIVVYYGALEPRSADQTGQSVTVISKADMERTGETRLANLIAKTPGVGILARGPMGAQTGFTIRGVSQNYVKVLVDGIDVSDPSGPQVAFDLGRLNAFDFSRVEIMRGSQSAVYGGQAVAGVINLDTPRPSKDGISQNVQLEAGSYNTLNAAYSFGWKQGDDELALQVSKIYTSGYSAADENNGNTEDDGYKADRISLRGQKRVSDNLLIGFAGFAQNDTGEFDNAFTSPPSDDGSSTVHKERGARAFAQFVTGRFDHEIGLSYFTTSRWYPLYSYGYEGKRRKLDWKTATDLGQGRLTVGADRTLESYNGTFVAGDVLTANTGVFAEYAFEPIKDVSIVASARHDQRSDFGGFNTGRLGMTWQADANTILRASIGNGFRAPSGYELYDLYAGNDTLEPEKSRSYDLGVERKLGNQTLTATLFRIDVEDLIDYSGTTYSYYQTSGTATRQGLELQLKGPLSPKTDYSLGYTYLDWKNPAGLSSGSTWNSSFGKHTITAGLETKLNDKLTLGADLRLVADRQTLPDYGVVNAQISYQLAEGKQAYLRVENLLDKQYELWSGYGTSDRAVYVGLRATF
jgi:vitamin B12 transporter